MNCEKIFKGIRIQDSDQQRVEQNYYTYKKTRANQSISNLTSYQNQALTKPKQNLQTSKQIPNTNDELISINLTIKSQGEAKKFDIQLQLNQNKKEAISRSNLSQLNTKRKIISQEQNEAVIFNKSLQKYEANLSFFCKNAKQRDPYEQVTEVDIKIRGGGVCCSKQYESDQFDINLMDIKIQNYKEIDNNLKIDKNFQKLFNKHVVQDNLDTNQIKKLNKNGEQLQVIIKLLQSLNVIKQQITNNINAYRVYIIQIFNVCFQYFISGVNFISLQDQFQINEILQEFINHLKKSVFVYPCLDLLYLFSFFQAINQQDFDRTNKFNQIQLISQFISLDFEGEIFEKKIQYCDYTFQKVLTNKEQAQQSNKQELVQYLYYVAFSAPNSKIEKEWEIIHKIDKKIQVHKDIIVRQIGALLVEKKQYFCSYPFEEFSFYSKKFIQLSENTTSSSLCIYLLQQISYILEKYYYENKDIDISQRYYILNEDRGYDIFIKMLQNYSEQQNPSDNFLLYYKFSFQDIYFRFLSNKILLQLYSLNIKKEQIWIHLLYAYATEKNQSIKILFYNNQIFIQDLRKELDNHSGIFAFKQVIKYKSNRIQNLLQNQIKQEEIYDLEEDILDQSDLIERLNLSLIEKWYRDTKHKFDEKIANQNGLSIEVNHFYIDQYFIFLSGNQAFYQQEEEEGNLMNTKSGISIIQNYFLTQNLDLPKKCKILGIVGQGGSGKSILLEKLQANLMNQKWNPQQQSIGFKNLKQQDIIQSCNLLETSIQSNQQNQIKELQSEKQGQLIQKLQKCLQNNNFDYLLQQPQSIHFLISIIFDKNIGDIDNLLSDLTEEIQIVDTFFKEYFQKEAENFMSQNELDTKNFKINQNITNYFFETSLNPYKIL
ncbi:hypothetical protein ABPG72_003896 [Tetrahymena utriculariae]